MNDLGSVVVVFFYLNPYFHFGSFPGGAEKILNFKLSI